MPVLTGDILQYLSSEVGSVGGARSATVIAAGVVNNLWPDISDVERLAGGTLYRKTFFKNNSTTDPLLLPVLYTPTPPIDMALSLGLGFDHAEDNDEFQGSMTALGAPSVIALVSDETDTRDVTIWGLDASGAPITETIALTNTTEVVGSTAFSKVYGVELEATSPTADIEVREGVAGAVIGTIPATKLCCWLWIVSPSAKGNGIALLDLPPGDSYGLWRRLSWVGGIDPVRPNSLTTAIEEA